MKQCKNSQRPGSHKITGILLLILGAAFLAYFGVWATGKVIRWSFDIGVRFILAFGVLLTASGALLVHGGIVLWMRRHKVIRGVLCSVLALFLLSFVVIEGLVMSEAARNDRAVKADFVLILGAGVRGDRPSLALRHRLDGAIPYIRKNPGTVVIVSGAKGGNESRSEAEVMKDYLVGKGIDAKRIIEEKKATNTIENIAYSKEIMEGLTTNRKPKVMIVTSDFHMFRSRLIARVQELDAYGISVPIHWSVEPICYCREYFSVMLLLTATKEEESPPYS